MALKKVFNVASTQLKRCELKKYLKNERNMETLINFTVRSVKIYYYYIAVYYRCFIITFDSHFAWIIAVKMQVLSLFILKVVFLLACIAWI